MRRDPLLPAARPPWTKPQQEIAATTGARVLAQVADVSDEGQVKALVEAGVAAFGRIDLLVCNAALSFSGGIHDISLDDWRRIIDVNLFGYFLCAREVSRVMIENGGGAIVQINSRSGKRGRAKNSAYASSKGGGIVLTQSLSAELAPHNIRVNAVCPGSMFDSPLWQEVLFRRLCETIWDDPRSRSWPSTCRVIPLNRGCDYQDVANLVVFLLSDRSSYITGQAINVTGGEVVW